MNQYQVGEVFVDICPQCHGIWFDGGELGKITKTFSYGQWPEVFERWKKEHVKFADRNELRIELKRICPVDSALMEKHYFAGDSDIGIDYCAICSGFWIDGGELSAIWKYTRPDIRQDIIAEGLYDISMTTARMEKEITSGIANFAALLAAPANLGWYALIQIVRIVLDDLIRIEGRRSH